MSINISQLVFQQIIIEMRLILFFLTFLVTTKINSQDTVRLRHKNYETVFDKTKKYPVLVEFWVTKKMVICENPLKRKDNFKPDPKLSNETNLQQDYVGSGFDRGHMMPAADNLCQTQEIQDECFYFSNISAQFHSLNAGDWKSLETFIREEVKIKDSVKVWTGNLGEIKKIGKVSVPKTCWKVIYTQKDKKFRAFIFENSNSKPDGFQNNEVPLKSVENLTNFKFRTQK